MATTLQSALNVINQAPLRTADQFNKLVDYNTYFNPTRAITTQRPRVDRYLLPGLQKQIEQTRGDFANRNLLRSGIRTQAEMGQTQDFGENYDKMLQQLVSQQEEEARKNYATDFTRFLADTGPIDKFVASIQPKASTPMAVKAPSTAFPGFSQILMGQPSIQAITGVPSVPQIPQSQGLDLNTILGLSPELQGDLGRYGAGFMDVLKRSLGFNYTPQSFSSILAGIK